MDNIGSVVTRCMKIGVATALAFVGLATPAHADPIPDQDATFRRLLDYGGVLFNFNLEKSEGQSACDDLRYGEPIEKVTEDLMSRGGYTFDVANGIVSAAYVAYCEELDLTRPGNR